MPAGNAMVPKLFESVYEPYRYLIIIIIISRSYPFRSIDIIILNEFIWAALRNFVLLVIFTIHSKDFATSFRS